jgi:hypothetical protein
MLEPDASKGARPVLRGGGGATPPPYPTTGSPIPPPTQDARPRLAGPIQEPPVQDDGHLWTVLRYIEANPARAGMVADLADDPWSSYPAHALGRPDPLLSELPEWDHLGITPAGRSRAWRAKVRAALPEADLGAIRTSLKTGRAFGDAAWCERQATRHGLSPVPRPRGRPRKAVPSIGQGSEPGRIV